MYRCSYSIWYELAEAVRLAERRHWNERLLKCVGLPSARLPRSTLRDLRTRSGWSPASEVR